MIRRAETDSDLVVWCEVWNAITPREPITVEQLERRLARQPERLCLVADDVGAGLVAPSDSPGRLYLGVRVLPEARSRGLGSALFERLLEHARGLDPEWLSTQVSGAMPIRSRGPSIAASRSTGDKSSSSSRSAATSNGPHHSTAFKSWS